MNAWPSSTVGWAFRSSSTGVHQPPRRQTSGEPSRWGLAEINVATEFIEAIKGTYTGGLAHQGVAPHDHRRGHEGGWRSPGEVDEAGGMRWHCCEPWVKQRLLGMCGEEASQVATNYPSDRVEAAEILLFGEPAADHAGARHEGSHQERDGEVLTTDLPGCRGRSAPGVASSSPLTGANAPRGQRHPWTSS